MQDKRGRPCAGPMSFSGVRDTLSKPAPNGGTTSSFDLRTCCFGSIWGDRIKLSAAGSLRRAFATTSKSVSFFQLFELDQSSAAGFASHRDFLLRPRSCMGATCREGKNQFSMWVIQTKKVSAKQHTHDFGRQPLVESFEILKMGAAIQEWEHK